MKRMFWLLPLLAATPALAQPIDLSRGGPINVTSKDGFEWREQEQRVIAVGDARADRGDNTVLADRLVALYRKRAAAAPPPITPTPVTPPGTATDSGGNEIYRLQAEGHVRILTPTDEAIGDRAVYDIDQAVLVMTGGNLRLTTPQQVITARDSLEYWTDKHMAVARGNAVVITSDGRRISGDTLVAYTKPNDAPPPAAKPVANSSTDPAASGKLDRIEAFGNVEVRTTTDIARGERGVYVPDTGIARVLGNVRHTHGQNQMRGEAADVNMKTGIARLLPNTGGRVQGLIMPNDAQDAAGTTAPAPGKPMPITPQAGTKQP